MPTCPLNEYCIILRFTHNGLAFHGDKSAATFGTRKKLHNYPPLPGISIAGSIIPPLNTTKPQSHARQTPVLTLSCHISLVCQSASYPSRAFGQIRQSFTDEMAKAVVASLVQFHVEYANSLLYGISKPRLNKWVQNSLTHIVFNHNHLDSSNGLLSQLNCLSYSSPYPFQTRHNNFQSTILLSSWYPKRLCSK